MNFFLNRYELLSFYKSKVHMKELLIFFMLLLASLLDKSR